MHQPLLLSSVGAKLGAERVHPDLVFREADRHRDWAKRFFCQAEGWRHTQSMFDASHIRVYITGPAAGHRYGSDFTLECCAPVLNCYFLLGEVYSPKKASIESLHRKPPPKTIIDSRHRKPPSKAFIERLIFGHSKRILAHKQWHDEENGQNIFEK